METSQDNGTKNNKKQHEDLGLTTEEALENLLRDIKRIIEEYEKEYRKNR